MTHPNHPRPVGHSNRGPPPPHDVPRPSPTTRAAPQLNQRSPSQQTGIGDSRKRKQTKPWVTQGVITGATATATATGRSDNDANQMSTASPYVRRKRAIAACQFCRLRKTKCDNVRPVCGSCRHHQARCVYTDGSEADGLQVGLDEAAARHREVLERLDDIRDLLARSPLPDSRSSAASEIRGSHMSVLSALAGNSLDHEIAGHAAVETESASDCQPSSSAAGYLQYTKCESMLKWPVLGVVMTDEDAGIDSFIFDAHVLGDGEDVCAEPTRGSASPVSCNQPKPRPFLGQGVRDPTFVTLSQKFLALVNCRNPILDAHGLLSHARSVAEDGLGWDAKSCLVLLACALASYSRAWTPPPFVRSSPYPAAARRGSGVPPDVMSAADDEAANAYYEAAQRRFGSLGRSLIDIQCFYYASLFERFALRPLQAWMYLQQATTRLRLHHMGRHKEESRLHRRGPDDYQAEAGPSAISYHLEQRAFWSIHKAEREFATELGITLASDLSGFKYPAAFSTPPETLNHLIPSDDGVGGDMSDVFSPSRNELVWFFYLAEISLRRTFDQVFSVIYEKGEQSWMDNLDLVCRQYYESEKQISDWQSHLPRAMRYDPDSQPHNEMAYYLEGRFEEWNECILRPLVYYCLHYPPTNPPTPSIAALAQRDMTLCVNCIMRCASHDRHGGTWVVLRRTFRCTLIILAAVVADGPLRPPEDWQELTKLSIATLTRWSVGVEDLKRMRRVLDRVFRAVCDLEVTRMPVEGRTVRT